MIGCLNITKGQRNIFSKLYFMTGRSLSLLILTQLVRDEPRYFCRCIVPLPDGRLFIFSSLSPLGGPHSQFPAGWNTTTAGLVKLGFAVLMGETYRISSAGHTTVLMRERNPILRNLIILSVAT